MSGPQEAHAVILAGGRGTRFWPLSRQAHPKQLLDLTGHGSLLALTLDRLEALIPPQRQWILTSAALADTVAEQAPRIPREQIIGEPMGRNTAPAVGLAAQLILARAGDVPFAVLPSDHLIAPARDFQKTMSQALELAYGHDLLLTFGVEPTRPDTGYGYIETGEILEGASPACRVAKFTEKPDVQTARAYLKGGRHLWNSGIFAWRASVVAEGLRRHLPQTMEALGHCAKEDLGTDAFASALEKAYKASDSISVDYALMERAENVAVLPADFQWNDVGQWPAMRDLWARDAQGNSHLGEVLALQSENCIVYGPDRLTALLGVKDLIVVQTEDATLVCDFDRAQDVKMILDELHKMNRDEFL